VGGRFLPRAVLLVVFVPDLEADLDVDFEPGLAVLFCADDLLVVWLDFVVDEDLLFEDAAF
jgi:hypothetical protein